MAWTEKGEFERALADINDALKVDPKYAFAFGQRGQTLFRKRLITKKGGWESAIEDFGEAIKLDPNLLWLYSSRGVAYSNNRQYSLAAADCGEVIKREPKNSIGYNCRGVAYEGLKDYGPLSPTMTCRSLSIQRTPWRTGIAAMPAWRCASPTMRYPTMTRRSH